MVPLPFSLISRSASRQSRGFTSKLWCMRQTPCHTLNSSWRTLSGMPSSSVPSFSAKATVSSSESPSTEKATSSYDINNEPPLIVVDQSTHLKNAALATALVCFCVGVATYSMNTVGQAGSGGPEDPLAALKQEAAAAQLKQRHESQETESTVDMLQKFQAGDYDPDLQEQLELEQALNAQDKKKKAWWNFWSRS